MGQRPLLRRMAAITLAEPRQPGKGRARSRCASCTFDKMRSSMVLPASHRYTGRIMATTLTAKGQLTIPKRGRDRLGIKPGMRGDD